MKKLFTNCKNASAACARGEMDPANVFERAGLRLHFFICSYCRAYRSQLTAVQALFKQKWGRRPADGRVQTLQSRLENLCNKMSL